MTPFIISTYGPSMKLTFTVAENKRKEQQLQWDEWDCEVGKSGFPTPLLCADHLQLVEFRLSLCEYHCFQVLWDKTHSLTHTHSHTHSHSLSLTHSLTYLHFIKKKCNAFYASSNYFTFHYWHSVGSRCQVGGLNIKGGSDVCGSIIGHN